MSQARVGYSFEGFEGEVEKIVLFGEDPKWSSYAELLEYLDKWTSDSDVKINPLNSERYSFSDLTWRIGKRLNITGRTPVEQAAVRQWIQYRITRLGFIYLSEMDKRYLEDILQELDGYLRDRTYLAGTQFSIADLVIYSCTALHEHLHSEVSTQRIPYKHCNLVRWFDQVSHVMYDPRLLHFYNGYDVLGQIEDVVHSLEVFRDQYVFHKGRD